MRGLRTLINVYMRMLVPSAFARPRLTERRAERAVKALLDLDAARERGWSWLVYNSHCGSPSRPVYVATLTRTDPRGGVKRFPFVRERLEDALGDAAAWVGKETA